MMSARFHGLRRAMGVRLDLVDVEVGAERSRDVVFGTVEANDLGQPVHRACDFESSGHVRVFL
jgi:hypothetical protein